MSTVEYVVGDILKSCDLYQVVIGLASKYMAQKIEQEASKGKRGETQKDQMVIDSKGNDGAAIQAALTLDDKIVSHED